MHRAVRVAALVASLALVVTLVAARGLGLSIPWPQRPPAKSSSAIPTPTPVDLYDVMGTLTFENGRTIPSARLHPSEGKLLDWLEKGGIVVNEIRPAAWWPSERASLPKIVRGVAVVHAFLVAPSAVVIDAVPEAGSLNASVCVVSTTPSASSYRLHLAGRAASFDYSPSLRFATQLDALLITTDDATWERLMKIGAVPLQAGPCST